jgi:hypothetical protein
MLLSPFGAKPGTGRQFLILKTCPAQVVKTKLGTEVVILLGLIAASTRIGFGVEHKLLLFASQTITVTSVNHISLLSVLFACSPFSDLPAEPRVSSRKRVLPERRSRLEPLGYKPDVNLSIHPAPRQLSVCYTYLFCRRVILSGRFQVVAMSMQ